ncbi:MAG: hypothetical protein ABIA63_02585 [bacterium]
MKRIPCIIFVITFFSLIFPDELKFSGYVKSQLQSTLADTTQFSDQQAFRLESSRKLGKSAALEAHIVFSRDFKSLDQFAAMRDFSIYKKIIFGVLE